VRRIPGRVLRLALALAALALAVVLTVVAVELRRFDRAVRAGDVRFEATLVEAGRPWADARRSPRLVRRIVAAEDDLRFRRSLALFRASRVLQGRLNQGWRQLRFESEAGTSLARAKRLEPTPHGRSRIANLLGVLAFQDAQPLLNIVRERASQFQRRPDPEELEQASNRLAKAVSEFKAAIELDDANDDAKFNLELALRVARENQVTDAVRRGRGPTAGRAGFVRAGRGY
jgi:hypothetical protein